jgi:hypothetical protein
MTATKAATDWREASRAEPCPICEKPDWCSLAGPEGAIEAAVCMRIESDNQRANGGWFHRLCESDNSTWQQPKLSTGNGKPKGKSFSTSADAITALEKQHGKHSASWTYTDGKPVGVIVRWDRPDGEKDIRPVSLYPDGWHIAGMPSPRPLYRLPELADADSVYVVEGEKTVEAARSIGLTATTSPHGSKSAGKADWSPLVGKREVVIFPDNDEPGRQYAEFVAARIAELSPATIVRIVHITKIIGGEPMPKGGDLDDWINGHGDAATPEVIVENLERLVEAATPYEPQESEQPEEGEESRKPIAYQRITSAELAKGDYALEYLINGALVEGQPLIIAGPQKTLKTSFIIDAAVSLASGGYFLGRLPVERQCRVAVMTGESGLATIQETAIRICQAAGKFLEDLDNLIWSPDLPRFGDARHLVALEQFLRDDAIEVLFIDPAYLAMPGADAGNVMMQGELLRSISELCRKLGVTMVLAHHTKKHTGRDACEPGELSDIAWSGFAEFARQWWLINRREAYEPGTGEHKLWLSIGGSAGHSSLWAVDVAEGVRSELYERRWEVELKAPDEARSEATESQQERQERLRQEKAGQRIERDARAIVAAMNKLSLPETAKTIRTHAGLSGERFNLAVAKLLDDGHVEQAEVAKPNRKTPYDGFDLVYTNNPETTYGTNGTDLRDNGVP